MRIQSLLLLVLPTLLALPVQAQDFDIQTNTVRIRMTPTGGMQIDSLQGGSVVIPPYTMPVTRSTIGRSAPLSVPTTPTSSLRLPSASGLHCTGDTQETQQSNRSTGGVSQTYSSSTTRVCQ
ncbi:MAG TPA: hypothetical protein V6C65_17060 [Allocoleopsis sp.]